MMGRGSPKKSRKKRSLHLRIPIKPLSTNKMYTGVKRRSIYYKQFSREVLKYLNENYYYCKGLVLTGNLKLVLEVGVSSTLMDASNCIKAIEDVIVKWCGSWDDRQIYSITIDKYIVRKGEEYINFSLTKLRCNRDMRRKKG